MSYSRYTSWKCYQEIVANGLLSKIRMRVYVALAHHGPCTAGELSLHLPQESGSGFMSTNNVATTLTQLRDKKKVVVEIGERKCQITDHDCILWEIKADAWPQDIKDPLRRSAQQQIKELEGTVSFLRARVETLERENSVLKGKPQLSLF